MPNPKYLPCIPTRGTKVPDRPDWLHENKHDGYRLIVQREGERVRLFTRNGHDWSGRFDRWIKVKNRSHPAFSRVMDAFG
jgi:bifunctional non-homologous end joining protein LigD